MKLFDQIFQGKLSINKPALIRHIEDQAISALLINQLILRGDISVLRFGENDTDIHFQRENFNKEIELPPVLYEPLIEWDELAKNEFFRTEKQEQNFRCECEFTNSIIQ
jgi:hypothetical protein